MTVVFGANGQLGSTFKKIKPEYSFFTSENVDITKLDQLEEVLSKQAKGSYVINCAAYTAVDKAEENSELAQQVNSEAVKNMALLCKKYGLRLIHFSTDYVFNGEGSEPYTEDQKTSPLGVYGETKLNGENEIRNHLEDFVIIRTSWVYSEFGNNFLKTMIKLSDRESLNVVNDQLGTPTYTDDIVTITLSIKDNFEKVKGEIFHFSNEGQISWYDFACEIMKQVNSDCQINPIPSSEYPTPAKRPKYSVLSKEKLKNKLNITIPEWKESLKLCLKNMS
ncbi:MAG: dTDP-4-dehydrorhamnose reductase [Oligoflexia bacterium]|nr:dTDP-4-dehydrorhamnose reductase [Oligoflexia bacterium]